MMVACPFPDYPLQSAPEKKFFRNAGSYRDNDQVKKQSYDPFSGQQFQGQLFGCFLLRPHPVFYRFHKRWQFHLLIQYPGQADGRSEQKYTEQREEQYASFRHFPDRQIFFWMAAT